MSLMNKNQIKSSFPGQTDIPRSVRLNPSWRTYQMKLQKKNLRKGRGKKNIGIILLIPTLILILYGIRLMITDLPEISSTNQKETHIPSPIIMEEDLTGKKGVQKLLEGHSFLNLDKKLFPVMVEQTRLWVDTTLDMELQQYLLKIMNVSHASHIGIVVMEPESGKIRAMVGFDKRDNTNNPCLESCFPAASIFKIVTAAGAIEKFGLTKDSPLVYNGGKYTLYKSQLNEQKNKYSHTVTLQKSFAESINPIFGILGKFKLKKDFLISYADAFCFNHEIDFELPIQASHIIISDEPYNWAEIASGFNRETSLSPLHAALIMAAISNNGKIPKPVIVEQIFSENGQKLYESHSGIIQEAVKNHTTVVMRQLMEATISSGTSRKAFQGYAKDQTLSKLQIGGKTGSIDNKSRDARIDWFVGFAEEKNGREKIVISVVVAHQEYIGVRAATYARMGITHHFKNYFAQKEKMKEQALDDTLGYKQDDGEKCS
jgi:penicillin-binding protein A